MARGTPLGRAACDPLHATTTPFLNSLQLATFVLIPDFLPAAIMRGHKKTSVPRLRNGGGSLRARGARKPVRDRSRPRSGAVRLNRHRQVFWLSDRSTGRAFSSTCDNGVCGVRPRLQRRDRGGLAPPSLQTASPHGRPVPYLFNCQFATVPKRRPARPVVCRSVPPDASIFFPDAGTRPFPRIARQCPVCTCRRACVECSSGSTGKTPADITRRAGILSRLRATQLTPADQRAYEYSGARVNHASIRGGSK